MTAQTEAAGVRAEPAASCDCPHTFNSADAGAGVCGRVRGAVPVGGVSEAGEEVGTGAEAEVSETAERGAGLRPV